jgi:methylmalonyl-CoA mutase
MSHTKSISEHCDDEAWAASFVRETGAAPTPSTGRQGIEISPLYRRRDLDALDSADTLPGALPFTRGARSSMYTGRPWTIRQYAGFATAAESNAFYRQCLAAGQRGLSVAFDLPTHRGYDSDHPRAMGDVGKAGVAIDSIEDMSALFDEIDLGRASVSMTMNGAVLPVFGAFIAVALERGVALDALQGTIQNDILKEFMVRHTYIYPPAPSMRIAADVIDYCTRFAPKFNPVSISGYHMQEAGATAVQELAFTLANGLEYVRAALDRGASVDEFAPRLSFFFGVGMDFFTEVAKLRAARALWAKLMQQHFSPRSSESLRLRMHCQTSGVSLTAQQPLNNVARTTLEALAAVLGGTQSLHTNSYDEALALPSDDAARVARNTQLIIQHETDLTRVVDPLGGSYYVEALTQSIVRRASDLVDEVEAHGGMTEAIARGVPQAHIERTAVERQVRIERGLDRVVGVNLFESESETEPPLRNVDNRRVLDEQRRRLAELRASRDDAPVRGALERLRVAALESRANLLEVTVECMQARATVGEVSFVLEGIWGRYMATHSNVRGVFDAGFADAPEWAAVRQRANAFEDRSGRKPRLLVAKLGQDGHDRGAKLIASGFADAGFDVDLSPLFQSPSEVAQIAVDHDVHVVGISTQAGGHETLVPQLVEELRARGAGDIRVVCGGIIPAPDRERLLAGGVADVFTPGTPVIECVERVLALLPTGEVG